MIILHAGLEGDRLLLWGEAPAAPLAPAGRKTKADPGGPLPYDAGAAHLAATLITVLPGRALPGGGGEPPYVWLPTADGRPAPSSGLIAEPLNPGSTPELAPWKVTALRLPPQTAVDLLCACIGKETLGSGILVGPTLAFWARALRFAGALVARE